jgi:hypothetical protein
MGEKERYGRPASAPQQGRKPKPVVPTHLASMVPAQPPWPPYELVVPWSLLQRCCVKCSRASFEVRSLWPGLDPPAGDELASVCGPCWQAVLRTVVRAHTTLHEAFWTAPASTCPAAQRRPRAHDLRPPNQGTRQLQLRWRPEVMKIKIPPRRSLIPLLQLYGSERRTT